MTTQEFVNQLQDLYGPFTTDGMMVAVMKRISPLSDTQRDKLLETYVRTVPGTYKPDLKNVLDCMEKAGIRPEEKPKTCICCGSKWTSTQIECPTCYYSSDCGNPEVYRKEISNRKAAVARLMSDLMKNRVMRKPGGYDE